jgi:hypothetical protein
MPMIDIYATEGTFADAHKLAADAAAMVKGVEKVPDIPMFRHNAAAFVHEMAAGAIANVDGRGRRCAGSGAHQRRRARPRKADRRRFAAHGPCRRGGERSRPEGADLGAPDGSDAWRLGLWGHAHTNDELVGAARAEIAKLRG